MFYIFRSASEAIWETTLFSDIVLGLSPNIQFLMFTIGYVNKCSKNGKWDSRRESYIHIKLTIDDG